MNNPRGAGHGCLLIALAVLFLLLAHRASAGEVLLETQQPFSLDSNTTLVIEDTNSPQEVVWLKLYSGNKTVASAVVRQGGHLSYAGKNITLYKIYSGGDIDLAVLKIENEITSDNQIIDGNASQRSMAAPGESRSQRYLPFF